MTPLSSLEIKLCREQGRIFEASVTEASCSSPVFIRRFAYSSLAESFDRRTYLYGSDTVEDALKAIEEEFGASTYGRVKYSPDQMFWIGYIYRCICIRYSLTSKRVFQLFNSRTIVQYYKTFHTFDPVDASERMMDSIGFKESSIRERTYRAAKRLLYTKKLLKLIGQYVEVVVDNAEESKKEKTTRPLSIGYVKDLKGLDAECQGAYVLGLDNQREAFKSRIVGVVEGKGEIESRLIVCNSSESFTKPQIRAAIRALDKNLKGRVILEEDRTR